MITTLKNPKSKRYLDFKQLITGPNFPWYFIGDSTPNMELPEGHENIQTFIHPFLTRPDGVCLYPKPCSSLIDNCNDVLKEIFLENGIGVKNIFRMAANLVPPTKTNKPSIPHVDHEFDHVNCLIYLNDAGGDTVVEGKSYSPKEDDAILFKGKHYMYPGKDKNRIVLVCTLI